METFWIALLGAVQGATEFLPVSSSGHLAVCQMAIKQSGYELALNQPLMLEIMLHMATLLAVVIFLRSEILEALYGTGRTFKSLFQRNFKETLLKDKGAKTAFAIVLGTLPTAIIGLLLEDFANELSSSPKVLGAAFLICAAILLVSRWWKGGDKEISWKIALIIGTAQGIAVLPGISRSGATIVCGLFLGLKSEEAAKFSFLLSLPAILGAAILKLDLSSIAAKENTLPYAAGALTAFIIGLASLYILMHIIKGGRLWLFSPYVGMVGFMTLVFLQGRIG